MTRTDPTDSQARVCLRFQAEPTPPEPREKVGIALQTRGHQPLNGLRHPAEGDTCGWYLWWGDTWNEDSNFYQPLHVEHLSERCPEILPYLALPPGWRVQVAPSHEDVWFDAELLRIEAK